MAREECKCSLCGTEIAEEDRENFYCFDCQSYICSECDQNMNLPFGSHDKTDHQGDDFE